MKVIQHNKMEKHIYGNWLSVFALDLALANNIYFGERPRQYQI